MPASGTDEICVCACALLEKKKESDRCEKYVERQEENRVRREK